MANEKRLIDANAKELIARINRNFGGVTRYAIKSILKDAPTVDAVEVVRCKDCKFATAHPFEVNSQNLVCTKPINWRTVEPGHFCSYGERREGE